MIARTPVLPMEYVLEEARCIAKTWLALRAFNVQPSVAAMEMLVAHIDATLAANAQQQAEKAAVAHQPMSEEAAAEQNAVTLAAHNGALLAKAFGLGGAQ